MNIESSQAFRLGGALGVVLIGAAILLVTALLTKMLVTLFHKGFAHKTDGAVAGSIFSNIIRVTVWVIGASFVLQVCFGFNPTVLWGALGIGGVALSLGLQSTVSNLIGGLQASAFHIISVGERVQIGSTVGIIKDINWRHTEIEDADGSIHRIPNSLLNTSNVVELGAYRPIELSFSLGFEADIEAVAMSVERIALEVLSARNMYVAQYPPVFSVTASTSTGIEASLSCHVPREGSTVVIGALLMAPILEYLQASAALPPR